MCVCDSVCDRVFGDGGGILVPLGPLEMALPKAYRQPACTIRSCELVACTKLSCLPFLLSALYPTQLYETIAMNQSLWESTFGPLLLTNNTEGCHSIHGCSHKITSIPATLALKSRGKYVSHTGNILSGLWANISSISVLVKGQRSRDSPM